MSQALVRHPDTPCTALERVEAELGADERGALRLRYALTPALEPIADLG